jgi:hypothetical protein
MNTLDLLKTVADFALIPLLPVLWNIQGRLSKIEGHLAPRSSVYRPEEK